MSQDSAPVIASASSSVQQEASVTQLAELLESLGINEIRLLAILLVAHNNHLELSLEDMLAQWPHSHNHLKRLLVRLSNKGLVLTQDKTEKVYLLSPLGSRLIKILAR